MEHDEYFFIGDFKIKTTESGKNIDGANLIWVYVLFSYNEHPVRFEIRSDKLIKFLARLESFYLEFVEKKTEW